MHLVDWILLFVVFSGLLLVGSVLSKKAGRSTDDFMVAGRTMPWWLIGMSEAATHFNTSGMLKDTRKVRQDGLAGIYSMWSFMLEVVVNNIWFMRLWRRARFRTPMEFYHARYRGFAATFARVYDTLIVGVLTSVFWSAIGLVAMKKIAAVMLHLPPTLVVLGLGIPTEWTVVVAVGLVAMIYSVAAGARGVYWTDLIQFLIAISSAYALLYCVMREVGWNTGLRDRILADPEAGTKYTTFLQPWNLALIYYWVVAPLLNHGGYSPGIQRMLAVRTEREVVLAELLGSIVNFSVRLMPFFLLGIAGAFLISDAYLLEHFPTLTDNQGNPVPDYERMFPALVQEYLPVGLTGLMIAALFCAFMSSLDTNLHILGSVFVNDFYRPYLVRNRDEQHYVASTRWTMVIAMAGTFYVAIAWDDIYMLGAYAVSIMLATGWIKLLRIVWWRVNGTAEVAAQIFALIWMPFVLSDTGTAWLRGLLFHFELYNPEQPSGNDVFVVFRLMMLSVPATLVSVIAVLATPPEPMDHLVSFYRRMRPWGFWGPVARQAGVTCPDSIPAMIGLTITMAMTVIGTGVAVISLGLAMWVVMAGALLSAVVGALGISHFLRRLYPPGSQSPEDATEASSTPGSALP